MVQYRSTRNDRIWKLGKQAARRCSQDLAREIEKTKEGLNSRFLTQSLKCLPNFIGCFAENQLSSLIITQYPTYLIANVDSFQMTLVAVHRISEVLGISIRFSPLHQITKSRVVGVEC